MLDRLQKLGIETHQTGQYLGVDSVVLQLALRDQPYSTWTARRQPWRGPGAALRQAVTAG
jgi:hypothetical protein